MTTIAIRDGILAVDSLCVNGNGGRRGFVNKACAFKDTIYAGAGSLQTVLEFLEWAKNGEPKDYKFVTKADDFAGLMLKFVGDDPQIWTIEDGLKAWEVKMPFTARGSGAEYAIGAMAAGATAAQAVQIASVFDLSTGGPIRVWRRGNAGHFILETLETT